MKSELLAYINNYKLMALATYNNNPWICWVFYVADENFDLYFVSADDTQHIKDINLNNKVACAITNTIQDPLGDKKGVQIWGTVSEVTDVNKLKTFFTMWKEVINKEEKKLTYKNYAEKIISTKVFKVTPKKIKWFNQELEDKEYILEF